MMAPSAISTSEGVATSEGQLILDSHKLAWHYDRVQAWDAGERIAPVSIDMALSRACQAMCRGCYAQLQESDSRANITVDHVYSFLDDCALLGVRGLSLISDGESTISKAYVPFIERAASLGIDVGNASNGWLLTPDTLERVLPHLKWVRFTVLAGRPASYVRMMHHDPSRLDLFWNAMHNIAYAVHLKKQKHLPVTLGIQTFLLPEDAGEIIPFAQLALDLGVDYGVIKHTSDDELGSLGVDYSGYGHLESLLHQAESMSTDITKIIVKWSKIRDGNHVPYRQVYGPQFLLQISGSGLVAPTGMFFNRRYAKYWIGDFTQERFYDIVKSERYWEVMDYLAAPEFNAQTMMGTLPIQHYANIALDLHKRGVRAILPAEGAPPLHRNFV